MGWRKSAGEMFESSLLSQINTASLIPSFVEVDFVNSLNKSLCKAFRFTHVLLAERSRMAAACLPWSAEIWLLVQSFLEHCLLFHADTTFAEMLFGLRRGAIASPNRPLSFQGGLSWWICGPAPIPSLEEQALKATGGAASSAFSSSTVAAVDEQLTGEEMLAAQSASYGHLRFHPITNAQRYVTLMILTLRPYLKERASRWYAHQTDASPDAVSMRRAYARRYPTRDLVKQLLTRLYPFFYTASEGLTFLYQILFLLEMTPYTTPLHRVFGIVLRRITRADQIAASNPRAQRVLMLVRVLFLLLFLGFRLLELTNAGAWGGGAGRGLAGPSAAEDLATPPPPVWGADVAAAPGVEVPQPGVCPVCGRTVANAAVCVVSGVVGCYPCLQNYARDHGACPLTARKTTVESIRRIYES